MTFFCGLTNIKTKNLAEQVAKYSEDLTELQNANLKMKENNDHLAILSREHEGVIEELNEEIRGLKREKFELADQMLEAEKVS